MSSLRRGSIHGIAGPQEMPLQSVDRVPSTPEQRKQRNRRAQAAFRERRTEYIKELEKAIEGHQTDLQSVQTAHTRVADELLMLRYKNSLLERILLENGIDVQAELREKTEACDLDPGLNVNWEPSRTTRPRGGTPRPLTSQALPFEVPSASPPSLVISPRSSILDVVETPASSGLYIHPSPASRPPLSMPATAGDSNSLKSPEGIGRSQQPNIETFPQPFSNYSDCGRAIPPPPHARIGSRRVGSMREAASFYLSSFLQHIESLEKEAENAAGEAEGAPFAAAPISHANLAGQVKDFSDLFSDDFSCQDWNAVGIL